MTTILIAACAMLVVAGLLIAAVALVFMGADTAPTEKTIPFVPPLPKMPVQAVPELRRADPPQQRIRLVNERGRFLGETTVERRRVSLTHRVGKAKALTQFVADHRAEDGVWVYRRVGTEKG